VKRDESANRHPAADFLVRQTTPRGHILVDTGFRETVALVESGVRKLGFRMETSAFCLPPMATTITREEWPG
jgi:hypothetical protein